MQAPKAVPDHRLALRDSVNLPAKLLILPLFWAGGRFHPPGAGERMAARLDFEIDSELETGLITGHAGVPGLIEAFRQTGTAAVIDREIKLKSRKRAERRGDGRKPIGDVGGGR